MLRRPAHASPASQHARASKPFGAKEVLFSLPSRQQRKPATSSVPPCARDDEDCDRRRDLMCPEIKFGKSPKGASELSGSDLVLDLVKEHRAVLLPMRHRGHMDIRPSRVTLQRPQDNGESCDVRDTS